VLAEARWRAAAAAHAARVGAWVEPHLARRRRGEKHPVLDFLFDYYGHRPAQLRRWHPGVGVRLAGAVAERSTWRFYAAYDDTPVGSAGLDLPAYLELRGDTVRFVRDLLAATAGRPAHLGCFGLHEWAMVYRQPEAQVRHAAWPLRLGAEGTDAVVEAHRVRCSHFDAFRFFTDEARPRNELQPSRATQTALEQPGCLHATMDLYKWAHKLSPGVPSELVADCFELARDVRSLDMRASPYDFSALGYEPVRIETVEGKARYVEEQRGFAGRGQERRTRLLAACDALLA
jgi:hypothetical protein